MWLVPTGVLVVAQVVASLCLPRGHSLTVATDCISLTLSGMAVTITIWNAVDARRRLRLFWILTASSFGATFVAQVLWTGYEIVLRKEAPNPFIGDVFLFLAEVPFLIGLLLLPHLEESDERSPVGVIDFLLVLLFWLYLYLFFVIPWQWVVPDEAKYGMNYNVLDAIQGLVTLAVLAVLWVRSRGCWRWFYGLFAIAQVVSAVTDHVANAAIDAHTYYPGGWWDLPYTASLGFFGYVVVKNAQARPNERETAAARRWVAVGALATPAVFSLPLMAAWVLVDPNTPTPVARFRMVITLGTMLTMAVLAFFRQRQLSRELARVNHTLQEASITDPLTGARNRRFFDETIEADIDHVLRAYADKHDVHTRDLVFYLIDADKFKEINDWYGHSIGDKVLVEMARRISTAIRNSDVLVRWGGEEFLVVSRYTDRREAEILASRVLFSVGDTPFTIEGVDQPLWQKCSVGWAAFPFLLEDATAVSYDEVLSLADRALYVAKNQGRNRAVGMSPGKDFRVATPRPAGRSQVPVEVCLTPGPATTGA